MSHDPNQPWWGSPPGYQPPEGSNPGGYMPPPPGPGYPSAYPPPPGGVGAPPQYYGAYPGPMAPSTSNWAIASLMCSIAGWFLLPVLGSVLGVIFGHIALGEIRRSEGRLEGRGMAIAGLIIGYAMLAFAVCVIAVIIAVIANGVGNPSFPTQ